MKYKNIVFDMDGTLLDGVSNITSTYKHGDNCMEKYENNIDLFEDIEYILRKLVSKNYVLGIVTSKTKKEFDHDFGRFGITELFDTIICADDTSNHKPHPEPLQKYIQVSKIKQSEMLYIGDSVYDKECAQKAGVDFALAGWGAKRKIESNYYLSEPLELLFVLQYHDKAANPLLKWAIEIQSLAQNGLTYTKDIYDMERFERLRELSAEMLSYKTDMPIKKVKDLFCNEVGYQTPKLDTRAVIFKENKILLVKENNGTWSLPGGWVDVNVSVKENVIKEVKEEAGLDVIAERIIAVQDRAKHNLPVYAYGVCKIFVLCRVIGGEFEANIETIESRYFRLEELPVLGEDKNNKEQIKMCFEAYGVENWNVVFD